MGVDKHKEVQTRGSPLPSTLYRPPQLRRSHPPPPNTSITSTSNSTSTSTSSKEAAPTRTRRPDREVYVPRARRSTPPSPAPSTSTTTSTRKGDRSFCNVYTPPHARTSLPTSPPHITSRKRQLSGDDTHHPSIAAASAVCPLNSTNDTQECMNADDNNISNHHLEMSSSNNGTPLSNSVSQFSEADLIPNNALRLPDTAHTLSQVVTASQLPDTAHTLSQVVTASQLPDTAHRLSQVVTASQLPDTAHRLSQVVTAPQLPDTAHRLSQVVTTPQLPDTAHRLSQVVTASQLPDTAHRLSQVVTASQLLDTSPRLSNTSLSTEDTEMSEQECNIIGQEERWSQDKDEDKEQIELERATQEINRSNRRLIKQSFVSDVLVISEPEQVRENRKEDGKERDRDRFNPEEEEWEAMLDESGECLEPSLVLELSARVGQVTVQRPSSRPFHTPPPPNDPLAHVVEVYNFPSQFNTMDLLSVFSDFKDTGFEIKWVDDNHALAVFSSAKIAEEVLAYSHPMVRTRPLHEATQESRQKARKCAQFLQPYRPRPETCAALARRLVTGALGVRLSTASQERIQEKKLLTQAREKKRLAAKHREAAWDGSLADTTDSTTAS